MNNGLKKPLNKHNPLPIPINYKTMKGLATNERKNLKGRQQKVAWSLMSSISYVSIWTI